MSNDWYNNSNNSYTALFFGEISTNSRPVINKALFGQEAYEAYQLYAYTQELIRFSKPSINIDEFYLFAPLYLATLSFMNPDDEINFIELGSTLFSSIEKFSHMANHCKSEINPEKIHFIGIEPSTILSDAANLFHQKNKITHYQSTQEYDTKNTIKNIDQTVSYSYMTSTYAFTTEQELAAWLSLSRFGIHNIYFSKDKTTEHSHMGKRMVLFNYQKLHQLLDKIGFNIAIISTKEWIFRDDSFFSTWTVIKRKDDSFEKIIDASNKHNINKYFLDHYLWKNQEIINIENPPYNPGHITSEPCEENEIFNLYTSKLMKSFSNHIQNEK